MTRAWRGWVVSALLLAELFMAFPELDLAASALFHAPGAGFAAQGNTFLGWLHGHVGILAWGTFLVLVTGMLLISTLPALSVWKPRRRLMAYLALVILLGPGLTVNTLFKDNWGRARPATVEEFGGKRQFSPAWMVSDQCDRNCSFVCGDAAVGFALVAGAFICRRRRVWLVLGLVSGSAIGLMRMAQGGHFLSDVVFSFYAVLAISWLLHRLMFQRETPRYLWSRRSLWGT